jgi:hypothetical protein
VEIGPPLLSLTVTTERAGMESVTEPADRVTAVVATWWVLSVRYAAAEDGVNPLKLARTLCAELPVLVKTTITLPSVFLKAPIPVLETVPVVEIR